VVHVLAQTNVAKSRVSKIDGGTKKDTKTERKTGRHTSVRETGRHTFCERESERQQERQRAREHERESKSAREQTEQTAQDIYISCVLPHAFTFVFLSQSGAIKSPADMAMVHETEMVASTVANATMGNTAQIFMLKMFFPNKTPFFLAEYLQFQNICTTIILLLHVCYNRFRLTPNLPRVLLHQIAQTFAQNRGSMPRL